MSDHKQYTSGTWSTLRHHHIGALHSANCYLQNRDRLELYALHKQAVSSDAPTSQAASSKAKSPAEKAKLNAWRTKRGLSQVQAMTAYILEADRQLLVYGTISAENSKHQRTAHANVNGNVTEEDNYSRRSGRSATSGTAGSVLLTPRGLAAIPLLCAAASEKRKSYLTRLNSTSQIESGWWSRQEPLCGDPGTILALPEFIVLTLAVCIEHISLSMQLNHNVYQILNGLGISPGVFQSMLWPMHNFLLVVWMMVIFISTLVGSALVSVKTMLLGSKRTGITLGSIFSQEIRPCQHGAGSLCDDHQTISVRLLGLAIYPLGMLCRFADAVAECVPMNAGAQLFVASGVYVVTSSALWWYWFIVLPWLAIVGLTLSFSVGWCFGLIELAGF